VPGGLPEEITAGHAARIGGRITPVGPAAEARCELAAGLLAGIRHLDAQRREVRKKLTTAVKTSGTAITEIFGAGPVIAATVIGDVVTVARFPSRDHFAACTGTAPAGVSSGEKKTCRLPLRGNRRLNHAIHMAAITQIRHKHSDGRAYYQGKITEGKTHKEALRCLKRRISDALYARLRADVRKGGPGGQPGNRSVARAAGSPPGYRLFGQVTPGPEASLRAGSAHAGRAAARVSAKKARRAT
jgi:transposase